MPDPDAAPAPAGFFARWGVWLGLFVFAAVLLTDVPAGMTPAGHRTLAVTALTAALWFTGAVPLGAASLVPLVAFPLLGVLDPAAAAKAYMHELVFLYLGGFLLALGLERWGVHERLALHTLRLTGSSPRRVVAGFMLAAAGLSMWISNTAATIMLLPVALAMLDALAKGIEPRAAGGAGTGVEGAGWKGEGDVKGVEGAGWKGEGGDPEAVVSDTSSSPSTPHLPPATSPPSPSTPHLPPSTSDPSPSTPHLQPVTPPPDLSHLTVALLLGLAWAASLGGIATPIGTPTNLAFLGVWEAEFGDAARFHFPRWIAAFAPVSAVLLLLAWGSLTWNLRAIPGAAAAGRAAFADRLRALGRPRTPEKRMLAVFAAAVLLWVVPGPLFEVLEHADGADARVADATARGWKPILQPADSTIAVGCALLAFALPAGADGSGGGGEGGRGERLLDWATAERLPWDILLLFGAGLALAEAFASSGLSAWVGERLGEHLDGAPVWAVVGAVCLVMTFLTECTSNVATCTIVLPVLAGVALNLGLEPELLMLPAAASASCAFMLPVATPPNAIVFGSGRVTMAAMARRGFVLNLVGAAAVTALTLVWVRRWF